MNVFLLLLRKELRDQRALLVASCVLAPICSALIAWAFRDATTPEIAGRWVLPGILGFFLAALATELATRDVGTSVGDTLARLPVPRRLHWAAKIAALSISGVLFVTLVSIVEWLCRTAVGANADRVIDHFLSASPQHAAVILATLAAFALASVTRKGFASAGLAIALAVGVGFVLVRGSRTEPLLQVLTAMDLWPSTWWTTTVALSTTFASWLAFDPRTPVAHAALRRSALFALSLALGFGSSGVAAYVRYRSASRIDPRASDARVWCFEATKDGRWIPVELVRDLSPRLKFRRAYVLDADRNELIALPGPHRGLFGLGGRGAWLPDGRLATRCVGTDSIEAWDPRDETLRPLQEPPRRAQDWASLSVSEPGFRIAWKSRDVEFLSLDGQWGGASAQPGVFFYFDAEGSLRRRELLDGSDRPLRGGFDPRHRPCVWIDPEARRVAVLDGSSNRTLYLDAVDGETLWESEAGWRHSQWTGLDHPWAVAIAPGKHSEFPRTRVRFLGDSASWEITFDGLFFLQVLPNDRLLYAPGHERLELRDYHGALVRTLVPLPDDVRVRSSSEESL